MVTTAGMTCSTTGAYDATGTADAAGADTVATGLVGAALTLASGAFHAARPTMASAAAARPPFLTYFVRMLLIHLYSL
jgi:hypothetical protein